MISIARKLSALMAVAFIFASSSAFAGTITGSLHKDYHLFNGNDSVSFNFNMNLDGNDPNSVIDGDVVFNFTRMKSSTNGGGYIATDLSDWKFTVTHNGVSAEGFVFTQMIAGGANLALSSSVFDGAIAGGAWTLTGTYVGDVDYDPGHIATWVTADLTANLCMDAGGCGNIANEAPAPMTGLLLLTGLACAAGVRRKTKLHR